MEKFRFLTIIGLLFILLPAISRAQNEYIQEGEVGIGLGAAHYFGDLNPTLQFNRPKIAASIFFRKNINNYIAARLSGSYAQLGYADKYNTKNEYMFRRNLSFNSHVWEATLQADFNFFYFMPGSYTNFYTPYITLGAGIFSYDPFAYYQGTKYFLRELGTEGQGSSLYPDRKIYKTTAFSFPVGVGFKYALNDRINVGFEILHRFTNTDYLDDVSTTYVDPATFPLNHDGTPSIASILSDRSTETGVPIGVPNRARGVSSNNDNFITAMFHVSFNIQSYKCPKAR